ncbi:MAG TPA: oxidoreductase [Terriglobales bacterium]
MIDVGLIGFGFAGRTFHAPVISAVEGLRLAAILERHGSEAEQAYPTAHIARSLAELLAIDSIQLTVVATSNPSHFELAKQCLHAGRHVVVDKPFTTTYAEAAELVSIAEKQPRIITVYQNRRWDGDFLTVERLVRENKFGRIVLYESHFDRFRPQVRDVWRERAEPGSGLLFDLGPHLIDQTLLLFGTPDAITAEVRIERDGAQVDDAFDVVFHYPKLRALLRAGVLVTTPTPRFAIQGTQGGYLKYGLDPQEDALKRGETPSSELWGYESPERWGTLLEAQGDSLVKEQLPTMPGDYRQYYRNVRDAILGKAPLAVTPESALNVMCALELAGESSKKHCAVRWER